MAAAFSLGVMADVGAQATQHVSAGDAGLLAYRGSLLANFEKRKSGIFMATGGRYIYLPVRNEKLKLTDGTTKDGKSSLGLASASWEIGKVFSLKQKALKNVQFALSGAYDFGFYGNVVGTVDNVSTTYNITNAHLGALNLRLRFPAKAKVRFLISASSLYGIYTLTGGTSTARKLSYTGFAFSLGLSWSPRK